MENMPKISVIVPVYNTEKYLNECLKSLIKQTLQNIEIICVNDGSTDNSLQIINEYAAKDTRIIVKSQQNNGQSVARNNAMKIANGEYISFIDSDDFIENDFLEKLYNTAKKHDADIAACGIKQLYPNGKTKKLLTYNEEKCYTNIYEKLVAAKIPRHCYIWNRIYKNSFLQKNNILFPPNKINEDMNFSIEAIYYCDKMVVVPNLNYFYNVNYNSTIFTRKNIDDTFEARKYMYKFAQEHNFVLPDFCVPYDRKKTLYKIFNIVILKRYKWRRITKYYLFGLIPILEIIEKIYGEN